MLRLLIPLLLLICCSSPPLVIHSIEADNKIVGRILWELKLPSQVSAPMTCYNGYLFAPLSGREIYVIDAVNGRRFTKIQVDFIPRSSLLHRGRYYISGIGAWNAVSGYSLQPRITRLFERSADPLGGFLASTSKGLLFATNRGKLFLLNELTGEIIAKRRFNDRPVGLVSHASLSFVLLQNGSLYSFNLDSTLTIMDSLKLTGPVEAPPVIDNSGTLFIASWHGRVYAVDTTLSILWAEETDSNIETAPAFDNSSLYILNSEGNLLVLGRRSGELIRAVESNLFSFLSPVVCGAEIVILGYNGVIVSYGKNGEERLRLKLPGIPEVSSPFCGGRLYIATDKKKLYCID